MSNTPKTYTIPLKYRKMENLHIVFWLFKDVAWCMIWKPLGIIMVIPTFLISVVIAYNTRKMMSELCHNLAVSFWITANSYWMISEFLSFDSKPLFVVYTYKHLTIIPFLLGLLCLAYYYFLWKPLHNNNLETM